MLANLHIPDEGEKTPKFDPWKDIHNNFVVLKLRKA